MVEKIHVVQDREFNQRDPYVWLEISLSAIQNNYKVFQKFVKPAICSAVLKADAYGMGATTVGKALFEVGCRYFFVGYLDEADRLSKELHDLLSIRPGYTPEDGDYSLFVFDGPFLKDWEKDVAQRHYIPVLNTLKNVEDWNAFGAEKQQKMPAVLHIDTGLNRLGMPENEYEIFKSRMRAGEFEWIDWRFLMSHAAGAAVPTHPANHTQLAFVQRITKDFPEIPFSFADTDCCLLGKEYHFSMVRIGIGLYGLNEKLPGLKSCLKVFGTVLQIRDIPAGSGIGYGWDFVSDKPMRVATVSCGYADGVAKHGLISFLHFSIRKHHVKVVGRISMDLTVVDITDFPDIQVGDQAVIIGDETTIDEFAAASGASFYHILTGFTQRARRFFVQ